MDIEPLRLLQTMDGICEHQEQLNEEHVINQDFMFYGFN